MINVKLDYPQSLQVHPVSGNIYFSDGNGDKTFKYCPASEELIVLSNFGSTSITFTKDEQFMYYTHSNMIMMMNLKSGESVLIAGVEGNLAFNGDGKPATETSLFSPTSLQLFEEERELYFYDVQNHRFRKINSAGIVETVLDVGDYPTFKKDSAQINRCYGKSLICPSRRILYISNEKYNIWRFDLQTKESTLVLKDRYGLMNWALTENKIYALCYSNMVMIDLDSPNNSTIVEKFEGDLKDIAIIDKHTGIIFVKYHSDNRICCLKIGLENRKTQKPFIMSKPDREKGYQRPREFFFVRNSAFNIPKLQRDTKVGNIIYFEPLLKTVAPRLVNQLEQRKLDADIAQYLVDYCIYHDYTDFKEVNSEVLAGLKDYCRNKDFDPILGPLFQYIQRVSGMIDPPVEPTKRRAFNTNEAGIGNENFTKNYLQELLNNAETSDFSINIDDIEWKCHKTILSKSKFFKTLIESACNFSDKKDDTFYMDKDTNPKIAQALIQFCYNIQPNIDNFSYSEIIEIIEQSKLHELDSLGIYCAQNLKVTLELFKPLAEFIEQHDTSEFPDLYKKLIQFARENTHDIIEKIYGGNLSELPSFIVPPILIDLPYWAQFQFLKQLK